MSDILRRDPFGRLGVGPVQGLTGADYPLVNPSDDIRYLLADFKILLTVGSPSLSPLARRSSVPPIWPFKITWLYGFGDAAATTVPPSTALLKGIRLTDKSGNVFVDTAADVPFFQETVIDNRLSLVHWRGVRAPVGDIDGYIYQVWLLYHTAWNDDLKPVPVEYSSSFTPVNAEIASRTVFYEDFQQGSSPPRLAEGANIRLEVDDETNTVTIHAETGAGKGLTPCIFGTRPDNTVGAVYKLAQGVPDVYGNLSIETDDCFSIRTAPLLGQHERAILETAFGETLDIQNVFTGTLRVGQDCYVCPDCDDYNDLILRMNEAVIRYNTLVGRFPEARNKLKALIDDWNNNVLTRSRNRLQLLLVAKSCPQYEVLLSYTNFSNLAKTNVTVNLTFEALTGTLRDSYVGLTPRLDNNSLADNNRVLSGTWPNMQVNFVTVRPFRSENATLSVMSGGLIANTSNGVVDPTVWNSPGQAIKCTATLTVNGRVKRAGVDWTIDASVTLACPSTEQLFKVVTCDLPKLTP